MGSVFWLTVRQLAGKWRLIIMTALAGMPVFMATLAVRSSDAPSVQDYEQIVLGGMLGGSITPLVVLAVAAIAFANEIEDRTLANLTLAPIARWKIVLPKWLASVSVSAVFVVASAFLSSFMAFSGDLRATAAVTGAAMIGVMAYAALFTWAGLVTTRAIGIGLLYVVLWEGYFAGFVRGVRPLSIRYHTVALMHGFDARRFAGSDTLDFSFAVGAALVIIVGCVYLATRRLRRMDIP